MRSANERGRYERWNTVYPDSSGRWQGVLSMLESSHVSLLAAPSVRRRVPAVQVDSHAAGPAALPEQASVYIQAAPQPSRAV